MPTQHLRVDATLEVGTTSEKVEVTSDAVHVETQSTQMGEVISGKSMTAVPLNGRSYTDLLALQPGVSPYNSSDTGMTGVNDRPVDGGLNSGNQSVNGQREAANGFMVNGSNVEEGKTNGAAIIPNLDAISEFRIITNNYDAEYGNYSGGQINVVTKSGTNNLHGSAFEFLRNTALDAKNYFAQHSDPTPVFRQNQFGGTFGGPIKKGKTFFFVDYQGTRQTQAPTVNTQMPSVANFSGDFRDSTDSFGGAVNGPGFASLLSQRLGYSVTDQEPYYTAGCTNSSQCVFPNAVIPKSAWSPVASSMLNLGLIPQPNAPNNFFVSSGYAQTLRDDKGGVRIDQTSRFGNLFGYYFIDDYLLNSPYPNGGASVPATGFAYSGVTAGRAQLVNLGDTKSFGTTSVNEFRFSYVRNTLALATPTGGIGSDFTLSKLGFVTPWGADTGGISPIQPSLEGVPYITFNNFAIGVPQVSTRQYNNSFQWLDTFSKVIGTHSLKFGGQFHYDQINERNLAAENGQYGFSGSETGIDFADFLIGAPDSLTQASPQILDSRTKYYGLFAQDSWRATSNLVFNYGLRWEASMPWYDTQSKTETIIPGKQSGKFPGAPLGYVVAGDPGVPRTLGSTQWHNFSPRLGLAYSPNATSGILGKNLRWPRAQQHPPRRRSLLHLGGRSFAVPRGRRSSIRPVLRKRQPAAARSAVPHSFHRLIRRTALPVPIPADQCFSVKPGHHLPVGASRTALLRLVVRFQEQAPILRTLRALHPEAGRGQHRPYRQLCRQPGSSLGRHGRGKSRQPGAVPVFERSQQSRAEQRRPLRTVQRDAAVPGHSRQRAINRDHHSVGDRRRKSNSFGAAARAALRYQPLRFHDCELQLQLVAGECQLSVEYVELPRRLHLQQMHGQRLRPARLRLPIRSAPERRPLQLRRYPQFRPELQLAHAVRPGVCLLRCPPRFVPQLRLADASGVFRYLLWTLRFFWSNANMPRTARFRESGVG